MKTKQNNDYIIFAIIIGMIIGGLCVVYFNDTKQEDMRSAYTEGLLYSQRTGNISYVENNTLKEDYLLNVCIGILDLEVVEEPTEA